MLYSWLLLLLPTYVKAIGQATCVSFTSSPSSFSAVNNGQAAPVLISADDWPGVQRAASDFVSDIQKVTGHQPSLTNVTAANSTRVNLKSSRPIIIGTLGKSSLIDQIINSTKLDVSSIEGQWEAFLTKEVSNPLPGVASAYVIIGSNKRGTIFALYDHSEQFGMSRHIINGKTQVPMLSRCISLVLVGVVFYRFLFLTILSGGLTFQSLNIQIYLFLPRGVPMVHQPSNTEVYSSMMSNQHCKTGLWKSSPMEPVLRSQDLLSISCSTLNCASTL